jgi:monofunctional biosynthetic peptidoglycan transglycosylase
MASSNPPFDAADNPTTQPLRRSEPESAEAAQEPRPPATSALRRSTNWFEPDFDADVPTTAVTQPVEPAPENPHSPESKVEAAPAETPPPSADRPARPPVDPMPAELPPTDAIVEPTAWNIPADEPTTMSRVAAEIAAALTHTVPVQSRTEPERAPVYTAPTFIPPGPADVSAVVPASSAPALALTKPWRLTDLAVRAGKVAAIVFCAWFCVVLGLIALYRFINPPFSSLMAMQWVGGTDVHQDWVPLESISPNLIHAVVVSEDSRFCEHWGIDFVEIAEALKRTPFGPPRGASTITMQVAKNLFLWPAKSYVRKVIEVPLTFAIELFWPKRRILEVYLNIAEWGPGIFGAEAASQAHFDRPASRLSARQAAQLAVALPNPIARDAGSPGPRTAHQASVIQRRTGHEPEAIGCVMTGG